MKLYTGLSLNMGDTTLGSRNSGEYDDAIVTNGLGDYTASLSSSRGADPTTHAFVAQLGSVLQGSRNQVVAVNPTSERNLRVTALEGDGAGGASSLNDVGLALHLIAGPGRGLTRLEVIAAGRITGHATTPTWAWASGAIDQSSLVRTGIGYYQFQMEPGMDGVEAVSTAVDLRFGQCTGAWSASALRSASLAKFDANTYRTATNQEGAGGTAAARQDLDMDVLVLSTEGRSSSKRKRSLDVKAYGSVSAAGGTLAVQSGSIASIVKNGTGDFTVTLADGFGIDPDQSVIMRSARITQVASGMTYVGYTRPSANTVNFVCGQEGAGGAASIAADFDFDFVVVG